MTGSLLLNMLSIPCSSSPFPIRVETSAHWNLELWAWLCFDFYVLDFIILLSCRGNKIKTNGWDG